LIPAEEEAFKRGAVRTARGKPWTDAELKLLMDMATQGFNPQQIYDSGKFPGRTLHPIVKQFYGSIVTTKPGAKVITIELKFNITLVFGLVALIRSFQVSLSEILSEQEEPLQK